ncbi:DUF7283 family protein [Natranaeroarchaeum aerophilus]|uniref:Uncharacterized protein n=1 Tax=Natranaeroarchaeum aerophilus TaxID=2917711 RepID=A0AAE3FPL5_9EURY|nr:hypothetical protein [Natranaeroarchaeum aerophilus]MCL9812904.1 hypothetical protein [Natranaeroarchaeum aerophilus]
MDFEAPVDAWYVFIAVGIVSVALAGLALGVSTGVPPDAQEGANAIEGATSAEYTASASHEHDAETVIVERSTITMENEHGEAHASFSYGTVVAVNGDERLEDIVNGQSVEAAYEDEFADPHTDATAELFADIQAADADNTGDPIASNGELQARTIPVEEDSTAGIRVRTTNNDEFVRNLADESDEFSAHEVSLPERLELDVTGEQSDIEVTVEGEQFVDAVEVETIDGFWSNLFNSVSCTITRGYWCDEPPEVVPNHQTTDQFDAGEFYGAPDPVEVNLSTIDFDDVEEADQDTVEIWGGTYDLDVEVEGSGFENCSGTVTHSNDWTELCGPDLTLDAFDDPHWHDDRGGVHYVTLVEV